MIPLSSINFRKEFFNFLKGSIDFLKDSIDFLKDSNDFLKDSLDFLKDPIDFLKDSIDFLKDSIDFLKDSIDFLKNSIDFLKESNDFLGGWASLARLGSGDSEPFQNICFPQCPAMPHWPWMPKQETLDNQSAPLGGAFLEEINVSLKKINRFLKEGKQCFP